MGILSSLFPTPSSNSNFSSSPVARYAASSSSPVINATSVAKSNKSVNSDPISNVLNLSKNIQNNNNDTAINLAQNLYRQNLANAERLNRMQNRNFEKQMAFNLRNWTQARDYDEYMSSTAYQRAVKDLKAAGLNPILATRLGGATYHGAGSFASSNTLPYYHIATNYMPSLDFNNYLSSAVNYAAQDKLLGSHLGSSAISGVLNVLAHVLPFLFKFI